MSPRSRGRPAGRGGKKQSRHRAVRQLRLSDRLLHDATGLHDDTNVLGAELWASEWLGRAWRDAGVDERQAEHLLCLEVVGRASTTPTVDALAALVALRRVAPATEHALLDGAIELLAGSQALPPWHAEPGFAAVRAWRAVDVWDSDRVLFVEFAALGDPESAHTLIAQILTVFGTEINYLDVLRAGAVASWEGNGEPPMPLAEAAVGDVLAELADALRATDTLWPLPVDDDYFESRALAWARCAAYLSDRPDFEPLPPAERQSLIAAFVAGDPAPGDPAPGDPASGDPAGGAEAGDDVTASLADLFLDYGDGYLHDRPLGWSPAAVMLFLTDWLPRKAFLDAEQRASLPGTLRRWLRFALTRRGVPEAWIEPVVAAVDDHLGAFAEAFDDESAGGPAGEIAAELVGRGVDLSDRAAVDQAIRGLNAERSARRLIDPGQ
ncbi:hypothetical protein ACIA5D_40210 [Actinoplanes sp. NPDC051513]|uniref:hypothetical protein n=1 Tax=Actinoplanes sp. NPDC051513 TaxID=3363908 RepID=UPI0037BADB40